MEANISQKILKEVQESLVGGGPKTLIGIKSFFLQVKQWNDEELWRMYVFVRSWGIDAIVRLSGLCQGSDINPSHDYDQARKMFNDYDIESFMKLNAHRNDIESIKILVTVWLLSIRIQVEIDQRLKSRKIGWKLFAWLSHRYNSSKAINDLLDQTRRQINQAKKRIPPHPKMKEVLQALSREEFDDSKNDVILEYIDWFHKLMDGLTSNEVDQPEPYRQGYSILKGKYPLGNPAWDDHASLSLWFMNQMLKAYLPMLCGEAEKIPLKVRDNFKTRFRRFPKEELKSLDEDIENENGQSGFRLIDLVRQREKSTGELDSFLVDEVIKDLLCQDSFSNDKDRIIAENYGKSDQGIADVIFEITGKSITKQAVQKRRTHHVEPLMKRKLDIRMVMMEEQKRNEENIWVEYDYRFSEKTLEFLESDQKLTDIIK
jgi:hypothetical protein